MQRRGAAACPGSRVSQPKIEAFVVDRIKAMGKDPKVFRETIRATRKAVEARKTEIAGDLKRLDVEVKRLAAEQKNLLDAVAAAGPGNPALLTRLSEVEEAHGKATEQAAAIRGELAALESQVIDESDLKKALASFSPVWDELFPAEKARVVRLLVEEVRYHAASGEIEITFRPGGIRAMAAQEPQ
jgi:site-specific DNA recombinase